LIAIPWWAPFTVPVFILAWSWFAIDKPWNRRPKRPRCYVTACARWGFSCDLTVNYLNILKIKPPMVTSKRSVDFFVDMLSKVLDEQL